MPAAGIAPLVQVLPGLETIEVASLAARLVLVGNVDENTRGILLTEPSCYPGDVAYLIGRLRAARRVVPRDWPLKIVFDSAVAWKTEDLDALDNLSLKLPIHINRLDVHAGPDIIAFYDHLQSLSLATRITATIARNLDIVQDIAESFERTSPIHIDDAKTILQALPGLQWTACRIQQRLDGHAIRMLMQNLALLQRFKRIHLTWDLTDADTTDDLLAMSLPLWRDRPPSTSTTARAPHALAQGDRSVEVSITAAYQPGRETPAMARDRLLSDTRWLEQLAKLCLSLGGPLAEYKLYFESEHESNSPATAEGLAEHDELSDMLEAAYRAMLKRTISTMVHGYREARDPGWKRISG